MEKFMYRTVSPAHREAADRRYVIWCAIELRPERMIEGIGYKLHVGNLCPDYVTRAPSSATFDRHLTELYFEVRARVMDGIRLHRESCQALGYNGPFLGGQVDLTTVYGVEYITFSATYVAPKTTEITRANLATCDSPGKHTADDIKYWLEQVLVISVSKHMSTW